MVQQGSILQDSWGSSIDHKLDYMIGNRETGQLVHVDPRWPVSIYSPANDLAFRIAVGGHKFYASDADANDLVTGQTGFDATTPTFLLRNPATSSVICLPLFFTLNQTGTVAGGAVDTIGVLDRQDRYSTGGTSEGIISSRPKLVRNPACLLYSGATATAAVAGEHRRLSGITAGQDVSPAEGALQEFLWTPTSVMEILDPGTSMLIYTYAATTGPTWFWTFAWAEIPPEWLDYP